MRLARSPVAPNRTKTAGRAAGSGCCVMAATPPSYIPALTRPGTWRSESPSPDAAAALGLAGHAVGVVRDGRLARFVQQLGLLRRQLQLGRGYVVGQLVYAPGAEDYRRYGGARPPPPPGHPLNRHAHR